MTRLVNQDRQIIATWREHGIPPDASTVEHAGRIIDRLADDLDEAWRIVWQLLDGRPLTCGACASEVLPALPLVDNDAA